MNRLKMVSVVWTIVVILLFTFLTTLGFIYKEKTKKYKKLEAKLVEVTKKYTSSNFNFADNGKEEIITFKELKDNGLINKLEVKGQKCNGYVEVTFKNVTKYKAYIKCDKYKTHNFDKSKLK